MDVMSDGVHLNLRSSQQIVHTHLKARNRKEEIERHEPCFTLLSMGSLEINKLPSARRLPRSVFPGHHTTTQTISRAYGLSGFETAPRSSDLWQNK